MNVKKRHRGNCRQYKTHWQWFLSVQQTGTPGVSPCEGKLWSSALCNGILLSFERSITKTLMRVTWELLEWQQHNLPLKHNVDMIHNTMYWWLVQRKWWLRCEGDAFASHAGCVLDFIKGGWCRNQPKHIIPRLEKACHISSPFLSVCSILRLWMSPAVVHHHFQPSMGWWRNTQVFCRQTTDAVIKSSIKRWK